MITFKDLTEWIIRNRTGASFKDYTELHIIGMLDRCAKDNTMLVIHHNDIIEGIVCGRVLNDDKVFYVDDILTLRKGLVKQMMRTFVMRFPGYTIQGRHRSGRERNFNSDKLFRKL